MVKLSDMYRVMCFNILTHNRDDHTKNLSFLYTPDKGWRLSPAYDLTYSDTYWGEQTTSVGGKGKNISDDDLIKTGIDAGISKALCADCLEEVKTKTAALTQYLGNMIRRKNRKIPVSERKLMR